MIKPFRAPLVLVEMKFGDREIVDLVREGGGGIKLERLLQLRQDHAEMCDGDDVGRGMFAENSGHGGVYAGGDIVPAFAARRADVAGVFPECAGVSLVLDFVVAFEFPIAEMHFAQLWIVGGRRGRPPRAIASAVAVARIRSEEITGAVRGRNSDRRAIWAVSERSAGRSDQPTMDFACVGP